MSSVLDVGFYEDVGNSCPSSVYKCLLLSFTLLYSDFLIGSVSRGEETIRRKDKHITYRSGVITYMLLVIRMYIYIYCPIFVIKLDDNVSFGPLSV